MDFLLLGLSALVPSALLMWFLYTRDAHPEPRGVVWKTFLWGAVICFPVVPLAMGLESLGASFQDMWGKAIVGAFLGAAIPEELFKFLVLRWYVWRQPAFDEPMDGIVYGATASLGFATLENLLYVGPGGFGIAILRALTAVPCHALTGVIMGSYVGRARFAGEGATGILVKGLLVAILLHGVYDMFLMTQSGWALFALVALGFEVWLGRRLIKTGRREQALVDQLALPTALAATGTAGPAPVAGSVFSMPPRAPGAVGPRQPVPHRTAWSVAKLLLGGGGLSVGSLLMLLLVIAAGTSLDSPDADSTLMGLGLFGVLGMIPLAGSFLLFRSGLKGPFVSEAA